jgi:hypothetical protein
MILKFRIRSELYSTSAAFKFNRVDCLGVELSVLWTDVADGLIAANLGMGAQASAVLAHSRINASEDFKNMVT